MMRVATFPSPAEGESALLSFGGKKNVDKELKGGIPKLKVLLEESSPDVSGRKGMVLTTLTAGGEGTLLLKRGRYRNQNPENRWRESFKGGQKRTSFHV